MLNKIMIIGNLGNDPELRYTQSGVTVASFRVATMERWMGQEGQMQRGGVPFMAETFKPITKKDEQHD